MTITDEMVEAADQGPLYYAQGREVWKRPIKTRTENGHSVQIGFRVCVCGDEVGSDGADTVAQMLSMAETFQVRRDEHEPMGCPLPGGCACPAKVSPPSEVGSEAEKRMGELIQIIDSGAIPGISMPVLREDLHTILLALSSERERAERAERERDEARGVVRDTLWMARRYADGRQSYAVGMYNDAAKIAEAGGYAKGEPDGTLYALDGLRPEYQTLEARAQAAEAKAKEAEHLIAKARTLSDTLKAYGYPVSPAHWANASGQMSVQARALHMAAENLIEGLAALRWPQAEDEQ